MMHLFAGVSSTPTPPVSIQPPLSSPLEFFITFFTGLSMFLLSTSIEQYHLFDSYVFRNKWWLLKVMTKHISTIVSYSLCLIPCVLLGTFIRRNALGCIQSYLNYSFQKSRWKFYVLFQSIFNSRQFFRLVRVLSLHSLLWEPLKFPDRKSTQLQRVQRVEAFVLSWYAFKHNPPGIFNEWAPSLFDFYDQIQSSAIGKLIKSVSFFIIV